ncbi:MAG: hypothetical protein JOY70_10210 [Acidisphaera sp.]|nr:hypothetical protein [Acidisphaera sp.]
MRAWSLLGFAGLLALAACGDYPRPFAGNPGQEGRMLAQPPPARLAVAPPTLAMLPTLAADTLAGALASDLVDHEIPAVVDQTHRGDWSLRISAEITGDTVVPRYEVINAEGKSVGTAQGKPVPASAWAEGSAETLRTAASAAAPDIAALLVRIDAAMRRSDPNSLVNRPARVVVLGVTGAPGDGNTSLARQMRTQLPETGAVVQDTATNADFSVTGQVATAQGANGTERIEIQWIVSDAGGERGRIVQLNEVPPHSLDGPWSDVALVVAKEAAGGVKSVIQNVAGAK